VRELYELGFGPELLDTIGLQTSEWALVGLNGNEVYSELRGIRAGHKWPQYSVHRGGLQILLYRAAVERLGADSVRTGLKVTGYRNHPDGKGVTALLRSRDGKCSKVEGSLLIAADGLHSAARQQMYPDQPPIQWGGAIMWRGVTKGTPIRSGASFVGLGTHRHRVVFYPISAPDPVTGLADINWIAEITVENDPLLEKIIAPTTTAMVDFVTRVVGWKTDARYNTLSYEVNSQWDRDSSALRAGAVPDLRQAVAIDPKLRVLIARGWNDLACPFMGSVLTVDQMPVMGDATRVSVREYPGGHMFYNRPDSLCELRRDVQEIFRWQ
jgi:2-polyprenyl-6-methoxyphenol hydroxylase-like FAD-dependent oxidoreductase